MDAQPRQRRLAAIVAIDMAGFSRRTQRHPERAAEDVARLRGALDQIAAAHGGRVFNTAGDGFMLEFPTATSACAAITAVMAAQPGLPKLRIGAHLGEVLVAEDGDLLGHGVNVAARLQALAEPGGALISQAMRAQLPQDSACRYQNQGLIALARMDETVEVFALPRAGARLARLGKYALKPRRAAVIVASLGLIAAYAASVWPKAPPAAAAPMVAVLPFELVGGQANDQQGLSQGLAEDILDALARSPDIRVVARGSAFQFARGQAPAAAAALNASHVLEGSIRREGDALRVSAFLSATSENAVIWSATYDRPAREVFAVQREIAAAVAGALHAELAPPSAAAVVGVDPEAYRLYLEGRTARRARDHSAQAEAAALLRDATARAPAFAPAWSELAAAQLALADAAVRDTGGGPDAASLRAAARTAAERALRLDPGAGQAFAVLAFLEPPDAWAARLTLLNEGARRDPMNAGVLRARGQLLARLGYTADALVDLEQAASLDPLDPLIVVNRIWALECAGRSEAARQALTAAREHWPTQRNVWSTALLFAVLDADLPAATAMLAPDAPRPAAVTGPDLAALRALVEARAAPTTARLAAIAARFEAAAPDRAQAMQDTLFALALAGGPDPAYAYAARQQSRMAQLRQGQVGAAPRTFSMGVDAFPGAAFHPLRADRRFVALMDQSGIASHWRASGRLPDFCAEAGLGYSCAALLATSARAGNGPSALNSPAAP